MSSTTPSAQKPKVFQLGINESRVIKLTAAGHYVIELNGCGARADILSQVGLVGNEAFELKVTIHHQASNTQARTKLLGTADDNSNLHLSGKIIIEADCQNCESFLTERVLLLSPTAKAQVIPDLEIKNNSVKCSHAASLSSIPADQIFYLMSRGLSEAQAKIEIAKAFLAQ